MAEQVLYLKRGGDSKNAKDWENCNFTDRYCPRHVHVDDINNDAEQLKELKLAEDATIVAGVSIDEYNSQMSLGIEKFGAAERDFDDTVAEIENKKWGLFAKKEEKKDFYRQKKKELKDKSEVLEDAYWGLVTNDEPRMVGEVISRFDEDYKYQSQSERRRSRVYKLSEIQKKVNNFLEYGKYKN